MEHRREVTDQLVLDQIDLNREAVYGSVQRIADSWTSPPGTIGDVLSRLKEIAWSSP